MEIQGNPWKTIEINENLMEIYRNAWKSNANPWKPNENAWKSMEIHGKLWKSIKI